MEIPDEKQLRERARLASNRSILAGGGTRPRRDRVQVLQLQKNDPQIPPLAKSVDQFALSLGGGHSPSVLAALRVADWLPRVR
jgi:hypothetical protein